MSSTFRRRCGLQVAGGFDAQLQALEQVVSKARPDIIPCVASAYSGMAVTGAASVGQPPLLLCGPADACKAALADMLLQVNPPYRFLSKFSVASIKCQKTYYLTMPGSH